MKETKKPARQPAGARPIHAHTSQLLQLLAAGEIAVEFWRAESIVVEAKAAYVRKIHEFESKFCNVKAELGSDHPDRLQLNKFTANKFEAYNAAKKRTSSIKRKLKLACQKAARLAAIEGGAA